MADSDFKVKAIIEANTTNFDNGMKKAQASATNLSNTFGNLSKVITKALSFAGLTVGVKAIADFGKECVKSADSANKSFKILNNTLKVTGATAWTSTEELVKMSEDIAHSTNYTVGEIQDMQSVLLGFRNITGETFKEASDAVTDMATVMGMDLKSAVQTVGKALDDPIKGLDSLRRQGFAFTDEQKKELEILVKNGEQLKAQKIILDELSTTYGGASKSAQSSFDKQKDAIIELKETIGNQLMPIFSQMADASANSLRGLTEIVKKIDFASIVAHFEYVVDIVKEFLMMFYNNIKETFSKLGIQLEFSSDNFETWKENIYNSLNNLYKIIQNVFGLVNALIDGDWQVAWEYAKLIVLRIENQIQMAVDSMFGGFKDRVKKYLDLLSKTSFLLPPAMQTALNLAIKGLDHFIDKSDEDRKEYEQRVEETEKKIQELTGKTANIELKNLDEIDKKRKKYKKSAENDMLELSSTTEVQLEDMRSKWEKFFDETSKAIENAIFNLKEEIKKDAEDWSDVIKTTYSSLKDALGTTFELIGKGLISTGHGFEDFSAVALKSLSEVLSALGAQLSALAVTKAMAYSYAEAAVATAGAVAAFVASGVTSQVAESLSSTAEEIDYIGESADKAGNSLKEFMKRLENIKKGVTNTTRDLVSNVNEYKTLFEEGRKEAESKLENLISERERVTQEIEKLKAEFEVMQHLGFVPEIFTQIIAGVTRSDLERRINDLILYLKSLEDEVEGLGEISKEAFEESKKIIEETLKGYQDQIDANKKTIQSYKDLYTYQSKYYDLLKQYNDLSESEKESLKSDYGNGDVTNLFAQLEEARQFSEIVLAEQKLNIQNLLLDVYDALGSVGQTIGGTLIDNIIDGATKEDFLGNMKEFFRENLIKLAVFTEEFQEKLAQIGSKISSALLGNGSIKELKEELEELWETASTQAKQAEDIISEAFGEVIDTVEEKLTSLEKLIKSFKESIQDLGGDIANNLIDGISNGLSQGDFLANMKKWIRKMLIQSVVYTESMKSEIEAIGKAISKGIAEGFSETSLHEIRRDLSWIFNQANETIESLDSLLDSVFTGGYATGTNNATRGIHLVGEAGPELVKFHGGEQVLNAGNTQKALVSGNTNNWSVVFNNLQDTSAFEMMNQLKRYSRQMAINGII